MPNSVRGEPVEPRKIALRHAQGERKILFRNNSNGYLGRNIRLCIELMKKNIDEKSAFVSVAAEDELERLLLSHSRQFQAILDHGRQQIEAGQGIGHADFWQEMEAENRYVE